MSDNMMLKDRQKELTCHADRLGNEDFRSENGPAYVNTPEARKPSGRGLRLENENE